MGKYRNNSVLFLWSISKKCLLKFGKWVILLFVVTLIAVKREVALPLVKVFRGANVKFRNWRQVTVQ